MLPPFPFLQPLIDCYVHQDHQHAVEGIFKRYRAHAYAQVMGVIIPHHRLVQRGACQYAVYNEEGNKDNEEREVKTPHIARSELDHLKRQEEGEKEKCYARIEPLHVVHAEDQQPYNKRAGDQFLVGEEVILLHHVVEREIRKHTGIGYANKKQHFFQRQVADVDTRQVVGVEPPYTQVGKQHVPRQKYHRADKVGRPVIFPLLIKPGLGKKAEYEWNGDRQQVNGEVQVRFHAAAYWVCWRLVL